MSDTKVSDPFEFWPWEPSTTVVTSQTIDRPVTALPTRPKQSQGTDSLPAIARAGLSRESTTAGVPQEVSVHWGELARSGLSPATFSKILLGASRKSGKGIQEASLAAFLEFWAAVRDEAVEPELGFTPDGSIHAEWFKSKSQRLDIKFTGRKLFFGLIDQRSIIEGAYDQKIVISILKNHPAKPLRWRTN